MQRKSRLTSLVLTETNQPPRVIDHITGEVLLPQQIVERHRLGFYSSYQIRHLNLPAG